MKFANVLLAVLLLPVSFARADLSCGDGSRKIVECSTDRYSAALCTGRYSGDYNIVTSLGEKLPADRGNENDGRFHYQTTRLKNVSLRFSQSPHLGPKLQPIHGPGSISVEGREVAARCLVTTWIWD